MPHATSGCIILLILLACASPRKDATTPPLQKPGETWTNTVGMVLIVIPPGDFDMGSEHFSSEMPVHRVNVSSPLAFATTEVTVGQFQKFLLDIPVVDSSWLNVRHRLFPLQEKDQWKLSEGHDLNQPMTLVTCQGARAYCEWLSQKEDVKYRLPSESEWEYACRAGTTSNFAFGEKISPDNANFNGTLISDFGVAGIYRGKVTPVGSFAPNAWGLYDMHGNVWEFCDDNWHDDFTGAPTDGRAWKTGGDSSQCVIKGGSWFCDDKEVRSAVRFGMPVNEGNSAWGFRVVLEL